AMAAASSLASASCAGVNGLFMAAPKTTEVDSSPKRLLPDLCTKIPPSFETPTQPWGWGPGAFLLPATFAISLSRPRPPAPRPAPPAGPLSTLDGPPLTPTRGTGQRRRRAGEPARGGRRPDHGQVAVQGLRGGGARLRLGPGRPARAGSRPDAPVRRHHPGPP